MALSGYPLATKFQANTTTAWFMNLGNISSALVVATYSEVAYANDGVTGLQTNTYELEGYSRLFQESELYISKAELLRALSGAVLTSLVDVTFTGVDAPVLAPYSTLTSSDFTSITLGASNFEGSNLTGSDFTSANCNTASFRNANLTSTVFTSATIATADFRGANLTSATLDTTFDTKSEFKALVGATRYDSTTTWVDGTSITA